MTLLDELLSTLESLPKEDIEELKKITEHEQITEKWIPLPGPQTEAYFSKADLLLYGGKPGGGKSDLLLGLAFNCHERSLIMRRHYTDLSALTDRAVAINGTNKGFSNSSPPKLITTNNKRIDFGACQHLEDVKKHQGRPHDFIGFDEGVQFLEEQVKFLTTWNRTTTKGQRCRVVIATNPPIFDEGQWLIKMFAPWLDPTHHNPAKPGELRYYVVTPDGEELEVPSGDAQLINGEYILPKSRTFIPADLKDNPYLNTPEYQAQLDSLTGPMRSALRDGNFMGVREDDEKQVIPYQWVKEAVERWTNEPPQGVPMTAIGVDVAAGGVDKTVLACRYDCWFAPLISVPGKQTPFPSDVAALVIKHRRHGAWAVVDMGGGYGGGVYEHLANNSVNVKGYRGNEGTPKRSSDKQYKFKNKRAYDWWSFREALNPDQPGGSPICLPNDPELIADLTSVRIKSDSNNIAHGIVLESKEDLKERLGRSPDKGDAVVMAWSEGGFNLVPIQSRNYSKGKGNYQVILGRTHQKRL